MEYSYAGIAVVPIIIGIIEGCKLFKLPAKWGFVLSMFLGQVAGILFVAWPDWKSGIFIGAYFGLAASGLYSGVKNGAEAVVAAVKKAKENKQV